MDLQNLYTGMPGRIKHIQSLPKPKIRSGLDFRWPSWPLACLLCHLAADIENTGKSGYRIKIIVHKTSSLEIIENTTMIVFIGGSK